MQEIQTNNITNIEDIPLVLSVNDLCSVLSIGKNSAYALIKSKEIASLRIGRNIRIPRSALLAYLNLLH